MKKIIILTVLLSLVTALLCSSQDNISISNNTEYVEATELAILIADILDIDTLNLTITNLPKSSTLLGAVVKNKMVDNTYVMVLNQSLSIKTLRLTMSHEFVHIKQYEHEGLEIFGDIWAWNPEGVEAKQDMTWGSMTFTGYEIRGFELDAAEREIKVNKQLCKIIKTQKKEYALSKKSW